MSSVWELLPFYSVAQFVPPSQAKGRIMNREGKRIPSIFYDASPDARASRAYSWILKQGIRRSTASCSVVTAVFRQSKDTPQLLNVQSGCGGHYQVDFIRDCMSCGGGTEDWAYSNSDLADYCEGYAFDHEGCELGCTQQFTRYNNTSPGCH